jgi:hypothetical protein
MPPTATLFSSMTEGDGSAAHSPLLAYLGAYYRGGFVDRFGKTIDKPSFKNGIEDGTISNLVRILLEVAIDSSPKQEPALTDATGKVFYPENKEPTFHKVFGKGLVVAPDGKQGISKAESKLIETGANFISEQALTASSALLEFLGSIDVGFVIAPNFAIGGNDTLKTVARTVIETSVRRGAERGLFCLVEKYPLDDIAGVIGD